MKVLPQLFENNRKWADRLTAVKPDFFKNLSSSNGILMDLGVCVPFAGELADLP